MLATTAESRAASSMAVPPFSAVRKIFSQSAVLIMADTGDVSKAAGLDIQEGMSTTIRQSIGEAVSGMH